MEAVISWLLRVFLWSLLVAFVVGLVIGGIAFIFTAAMRFAPVIVGVGLVGLGIWRLGTMDEKRQEKPEH